MNLSLDLQIATDDPNLPTLSDIESWVSLALGKRKENAQVCVRIVDENEIVELNFNYRAKKKPTNVLSFPADLPDYIDIPMLGDLVICAAVVERESAEQGKSRQSHWAHMTIHGTLHLLGYDHIIDSEATIMENLEIELLDKLKIPNPYVNSV
jgi:probable rRNA maturation factor